MLRLQLEPGIFRKSGLKIAYSPLNGAGHKSVIAALSRAGLEEIYVVADQSRPNGDFPTCPSPNPENPDTMKMTLDLGRYIQADIAFATDPDSDRIGVAAPEADGSWRLFTGNELGVLLLDWLTSGWTTLHAFCVYRSSLADPLFYVRLFGHVLGHADFDHFLGNMLLLLVIGPPLEEKYGSRTLLAGILLTAGVSGILQCVFFPGSALLGASGIVFMLIMLASLAGMKDGRIPLTLILAAVLYLGQEVYAMVALRDNVANFMHLVGGVTGTVFGVVLAKRR